VINPFVVLERHGFSYRVLGDMPTPALIDASNDGRPHDAYQHPDTGFWRLRDDKYDADGTVYTSVYVSHVPKCPGFGNLMMDHLVEWGTPLYGPKNQCYDDAVYDGILPQPEEA
jgi:hypothetical protein